MVRRFFDVDEVIIRHAINGDMRLGVHISANGFRRRMRDAVPCRIAGGDRNGNFRMTHQHMGIHREAIAQLAARQRDNNALHHRDAIQLQRHHIPGRRIHAGYGTGDLRKAAVRGKLFDINKVITRDGINMHLVYRKVVDMHVVVADRRHFVAYRIIRDNRRPDVDIFILVALVVAERRRIDRDLVAQLTVIQRNDFTLKRVAIDLKADNVVKLRITIDGAGDELLSHIQFAMVQGVIGGHLINRNARFRVQIDMHHMVVRYR